MNKFAESADQVVGTRGFQIGPIGIFEDGRVTYSGTPDEAARAFMDALGRLAPDYVWLPKKPKPSVIHFIGNLLWGISRNTSALPRHGPGVRERDMAEKIYKALVEAMRK